MPRIHSHEPRLTNSDMTRAVSPTKHMIIGFSIIAGSIIGLVPVGYFTIWLWSTIGFIATAFMYISIAFMIVITLILRAYRRSNHGFSVLAHYDPEYADWFGSTARRGTPHDPYSLIPGSTPKRKPLSVDKE